MYLVIGRMNHRARHSTRPKTPWPAHWLDVLMHPFWPDIGYVPSRLRSLIPSSVAPLTEMLAPTMALSKLAG